MKHTVEMYSNRCGCRSVGECTHNVFVGRTSIEACVRDFSDQLRQKLVHKWLEGKSGWDDHDWSYEDIVKQLIEHIEKGDMLDVAAFAMFAWNKQP